MKLTSYGPKAVAALIATLSVIALASSGCLIGFNRVDPSSDPELSVTDGALGSAENPVRCNGPEGQRRYLSRLRGPDGQPVRFERLGNVGSGVYGNIVDLYIVESADGSTRKEVFMDMYFPGHVENKPVEGFTIVGTIF